MNPEECKWVKLTPWWNPFKRWHDCTLPSKVEYNGGKCGICIFGDSGESCPDFTPKTEKK